MFTQDVIVVVTGMTLELATSLVGTEYLMQD